MIVKKDITLRAAIAAVVPAALAMVPQAAHAKATEYELRITNDTDSDLKFWLHDGQSKHAKLMYNGKSVSSHTVKAGTYAVISVMPTLKSCDLLCNGCTPTIGKVYASYTDEDGEEQRNNYYEPRLEWYQQCSASGNKNFSAYTTNWNFQHGGGKGDKHFAYKIKDTDTAYTSKNSAQGLTFDGAHVSGHAKVTYTNRD